MYKKPSAVWVESKIIDDKIDPNYNNALYIECLDDRYRKLDCEIKQNGEIIDELTDYTANGSFGWLKQNVVYSDDTGVPFIRIKNITEDGFDFGDLVYINTESYDKLKKSKLNGGELLFSKTGSVGTTLVVPSNINKMSLADNIFKVIYKPNIDTYYIDAFFKSYYGKLWVKRLSQGGVQQTIIKNSFREIKIPIPSPEIQKYIGDKVRKAEELREEAKRLKKEAEEILNAELKLSYFNERVKDAPKIYNWIYGESIEIRIDSQYYINETNFINNEMYKKGLKLKRISEIANVGKGFSYTSLDNKSIPYIRISDLDDLLINFDTAELVDEKTYSEKKSSQLEKYDLIFAITGATIGKVSLFYNSKYSKATLSSDTAFVRLKDKNDAAYVLLYLKSFIGQLGILKGVTGATNRHLSLEHIGDIFIPVIDNKLKQEINMRVIKAIDNVYLSKQLIKEAKQDVEDLIEGNFDMSKVKANS